LSNNRCAKWVDLIKYIIHDDFTYGMEEGIKRIDNKNIYHEFHYLVRSGYRPYSIKIGESIDKIGNSYYVYLFLIIV